MNKIEELKLKALDWIMFNTKSINERQEEIRGCLMNDINLTLNPTQSKEDCCEMTEKEKEKKAKEVLTRE